MYEVAVFVHIAAAIIWVGGGFYGMLVGTRMANAGNDQATAGFANQVEWSGLRLFTPASLLVVLAGVFMVIDSDAWGFGQTWIWASLGIYAISFIVGAAYLGPTAGKLGKILETKGPSDPEYKTMLGQLLRVSRFDVFAMFIIVALMVFKPGA